MDIIRLVLMEQEGGEGSEDARKNLGTFPEADVTYNVCLAVEAGLVRGEVVHDSHGAPRGAGIFGLTWEGHEFLDKARNETVWNEATKRAKEKGLSLPFDVLGQVLGGMVRNFFG